MSEPDFEEIFRLREIASGYWKAWAMQEACHLNLFGALSDAPSRPEALAEKLSLEPMAVERLCEAMAACGALVRHDDGTYANTAAARAALVQGSEYDQTGILAHYRGDRWIGTEFEKTFLPGFAPPEGGYKLPETGVDRVRAADSTGRLQAETLFGKVTIPKGARILDLGGGSGIYSHLAAMKDPELRATVVELESMAAGARTLTRERGLDDRVEVITGDFLKEELGSDYDLALISDVTHIVPPEASRQLFVRAFKALRGGGTTLVHDLLRECPGQTDPMPAVLGLALHFKFSKTTRTLREVVTWLEEAGFVDPHHQALPPGSHTAVLAPKP